MNVAKAVPAGRLRVPTIKNNASATDLSVIKLTMCRPLTSIPPPPPPAPPTPARLFEFSADTSQSEAVIIASIRTFVLLLLVFFFAKIVWVSVWVFACRVRLRGKTYVNQRSSPINLNATVANSIGELAARIEKLIKVGHSRADRQRHSLAHNANMDQSHVDPETETVGKAAANMFGESIKYVNMNTSRQKL